MSRVFSLLQKVFYNLFEFEISYILWHIVFIQFFKKTKIKICLKFLKYTMFKISTFL